MVKQASRDPQEPQASSKPEHKGLSAAVLAAAKEGDWAGVERARGIKVRGFRPEGRKNSFGEIGVNLDVACEKCGFQSLRNEPAHATCVVCGEVYWA